MALNPQTVAIIVESVVYALATFAKNSYDSKKEQQRLELKQTIDVAKQKLEKL